jgi:hypothetical protein
MKLICPIQCQQEERDTIKYPALAATLGSQKMDETSFTRETAKP